MEKSIKSIRARDEGGREGGKKGGKEIKDGETSVDID